MSQPQPYDIMIIRPASDGKIAHFTGEIPNDLWTVLLRFRERFSKLEACLRECENLNLNCALSWSRDDEALKFETHSAIRPNDLYSILHCLRPFQLQNNKPDISFNMTVNRLQKYIREGIKGKHEKDIHYVWLKEFFKSLKEEYNGQAGQKQWVIESVKFTSSGEIQPSDNKPINCENMLNNWLNAYEFHHDEEKQHLIEDIGKGFPPGFLDSIFVGMILDKIKAINRFTGLIDRLGTGQVNICLP